MVAVLHYPNQLLISEENMKYTWPSTDSHNESIIMLFRIKNVEIVKRRSKPSRICRDWDNYDDNVMVSHVKRIGCRAPYHNSYHKVKFCTTKEKMKEVMWKLTEENHGIHPPCKTIEKIFYKYEENIVRGSSQSDYLWIGVDLRDDKFKEILQIR